MGRYRPFKDWYYSYFRRGKETIQRPVLYRGLNEEEIKIIKKDKNKLESINKYIYDYLVSVNWDLNKVMLKFSNEDVAGNKVIPIKSAGTGCVFISNSVLKQIEFHTNENEEGFQYDLKKYLTLIFSHKLPTTSQSDNFTNSPCFF